MNFTNQMIEVITNCISTDNSLDIYWGGIPLWILWLGPVKKKLIKWWLKFWQSFWSQVVFDLTFLFSFMQDQSFQCLEYGKPGESLVFFLRCMWAHWNSKQKIKQVSGHFWHVAMYEEANHTHKLSVYLVESCTKCYVLLFLKNYVMLTRGIILVSRYTVLPQLLYSLKYNSLRTFFTGNS